MPGTLHKVASKFQYGLVLKWLTDRLDTTGLRIRPWYLVLEGSFGQPSPFNPADYADLEIVRLAAADATEMNELAGRDCLELMLQRFGAGHLCLGLRQQGRLVAFTWASVTHFECQLPRLQQALKSDEAYLFDAFTCKSMRGRSILPYLRDVCYRELERSGRTRCFSVSEVFNTPSIKFKLKLGAKIIELHVAIDLFGLWQGDWLLRRHDEQDAN